MLISSRKAIILRTMVATKPVARESAE